MFRVTVIAVVVCVGVLSVFFAILSSADATEEGDVVHVRSLQVTVEELSLPEISATSFYVFDVETNTPIVFKNHESARPIASITKLFSARAMYEHSNTEKKVTIDEIDVATYGDAGRLQVGQEYTAYQLLFPALLESSNDATTALARNADTDIVLAMNALSGRYGVSDVVFADASGLSSGNVASAKSLAVLLRSLLYEQTHLINITQLSQYVLPDVVWLNNNPLRSLPGYKGGKQGFTYEAGYTAVALYEEEFGTEKRTIGYVLLGSDHLVSDMNALRAYAESSLKFE